MLLALAAALVEIVLAFPFLTKRRVSFSETGTEGDAPFGDVKAQPTMEGEGS